MLFGLAGASSAQDPGPRWAARWIGHPTASPRAFGVFHFARTLSLTEVPDSLPVYVSADPRYRLYVNGDWVAAGPARGDLLHWRYRRLDLAPHLRPGENVIAATVWNFGEHAPAAQISSQTAFLLQAGGGFGDSLDTGPAWRVLHDTAYAPEIDLEFRRQTYAVVGPGERLRASAYPWGWERGPRGAGWVEPQLGARAVAQGYGTDGGRYLVPRDIPAQLGPTTGWGALRRGGAPVPTELTEVAVPPATSAAFLIDYGVLTTGYPTFVADGGRGAVVRITYAEALTDSLGRKGHRDAIVDSAGAPRGLIGHRDVFELDGGRGRSFGPLWWRTMRYALIEVQTAEDSVRLRDFRWRLTGTPLVQRARMTTGDAGVDSLWRVGWRTAQVCAQETYVDCPYYEQLQYAGDTRIQSLISLYGSGEHRLARRAILDFYASSLPNGLTQSRYPSSQLQVIPPYSLFWVAMVYDYHRLRPDDGAVEEVLPAVGRVLEWHASRVNERGLLGRTRWWNFVDWTAEWPWDDALREGGVPPQTDQGDNATLTLQYAYVLGLAAELYAQRGLAADAANCERQRRALVDAVIAQCYDADAGLVRELPGSQVSSQHAQAMAVLAADEEQLARLSELTERVGAAREFPGEIRATMYYRFYLAEALARLGLGHRYLATLEPWRDMLALGLTTFAEKPEPTRSDAHAWSASPNYHLLSLVAGIRPGAAGFAEVEVEPSLGDLDSLSAAMPHPAGLIELYLEGGEGPGGISRAELSVPPGTPARLLLGGQRFVADERGRLSLRFD